MVYFYSKCNYIFTFTYFCIKLWIIVKDQVADGVEIKFMTMVDGKVDFIPK